MKMRADLSLPCFTSVSGSCALKAPAARQGGAVDCNQFVCDLRHPDLSDASVY
jgi:hypothetical protein